MSDNQSTDKLNIKLPNLSEDTMLKEMLSTINIILNQPSPESMNLSELDLLKPSEELYQQSTNQPNIKITHQSDLTLFLPIKLSTKLIFNQSTKKNKLTFNGKILQTELSTETQSPENQSFKKEPEYKLLMFKETLIINKKS